ncbi:MAG: ribonuclease HI [Clostridiales bacterium]|nr:ribonuclease HI [Clostridiales bacterium]
MTAESAESVRSRGKKEVRIYTDGACSGNPGVGGWGAILIYNSDVREISGGERLSTNNRMELTAVLQALAMLKKSCRVTVYSDSAYVVRAVSESWIFGWSKSGWRTAGGDDVKNSDLWERLLAFLSVHEVSFVKVKGHSDNEYNNRCDKLAREAAAKVAASAKTSDT